MEVIAQFTLRLPIKVTPKSKWYVASCPIIDVHSQGETENKARKNLIEALSLFFITCFERGTLDSVLKECGFEPIHPAVPSKKKPSIPRENYINVPIPFLVKQDAHVACHA